MLSWILSAEIVRLCMAATVLTLGTGRTANVTTTEGNTWNKTVIAESQETGFSASIVETSWDGTHLRVWIPDGEGNCTCADTKLG